MSNIEGQGFGVGTEEEGGAERKHGPVCGGVVVISDEVTRKYQSIREG